MFFSVLPASSTLAADPSPSYFQYFPGSPFTLGRGFVQNDLNKQFVTQCVTGVPVDAVDSQGLQFSEFETYLVRDYSTLLDKMGFDIHVSAHSPTSSFDASYKDQRQRIEDRSSLTAVVQISGEYSPVVLKDARLAPEYSEMLQKGLIDNFITECGARVVNKERRGIRLNAIITISNTSNRVRQQIDASIGGSYGGGSLTAEAKATFNKEFEQAKRESRVSVKITAIGGQGTDAFEQMIAASIKDITSIDGVGQALATYAKTLTKQNAGVIGYWVADMPALAVAAKDPWIQEKQSQLERLANFYRTVRDKRDAIDRIVTKQDPRYAAYTPESLSKLAAQRDNADSLVMQILQIHGSCKASYENSFPTACAIPTAVKSGAADLASIPLIGPPQVDYALAVRVGPSPDQTTMADWSWADDRAVVRLLDRQPSRASLLDYGSTPSFFEDGFFRDVPSEVADAKHAILGVRVTSEYLEAVRVKFVADSGTFRTGYQENPYIMREFGKAVLDGYDLEGPAPRPFDAESRHSRFFVMQTASIVPPPPAPSSCKAGFFSNHPECLDYRQRYTGPLRWQLKAADHLYPWIDFSAVVQNWIADGQAYSGTGRLVMEAKDRFGGATTFNLIRFAWDLDQNLQIGRVKYSLSDGSREERWFVKNLGDVSLNFPVLVRKFRWAGEGKETSGSSAFPALTDKWSELTIKYCPSTATVQPQNPGQSSYLTTNVSTDRRTATAAYNWTEPPHKISLPIVGTTVLPTTPGPFVIDVALRSVVKVKETSFGFPDFFDTDDGCQ
ncbi:hypothetical protein [Rugamonas aquatica]|uniref:MACPF domain-containing protein n=1 Tax=Rugamonas aquatica TaxID=2743357 RepID=A0A6A7N6S7_9BURK|nr:hypothetical protein [Rugamonas aquatica]MQA40582.1 hypothetical protein [Rugamonas aquatica]